MAIFRMLWWYWCSRNVVNDVGNRADKAMIDSGFLPFFIVAVLSMSSENKVDVLDLPQPGQLDAAGKHC